MSHDATNWAIKTKGLRPITKIVLWHLADCHNPAGGCFPTQSYLAEQCEVSRASINRQLDELEQLGLIRREARIDPETKRQLPTRYRLAFESGFEPLDVASRVSELDTENSGEPCLKNDQSRVSNWEVSVSHSSETLTCKGTGKTNQKSPQPPLAGGRDFASLWEEWPFEHRGNRENAEGAFNRLSHHDQGVVLGSATLAIKAMSRRKTRFPALVRFIRDRQFEDFDNGPDVDEDGRFVIKPGREEWSAWLGWLRSKYGQRGVDQTVKLGFFLPERRWPEGHQHERTAA